MEIEHLFHNLDHNCYEISKLSNDNNKSWEELDNLNKIIQKTETKLEKINLKLENEIDQLVGTSRMEKEIDTKNQLTKTLEEYYEKRKKTTNRMFESEKKRTKAMKQIEDLHSQIKMIKKNQKQESTKNQNQDLFKQQQDFYDQKMKKLQSSLEEKIEKRKKISQNLPPCYHELTILKKLINFLKDQKHLLQNSEKDDDEIQNYDYKLSGSLTPSILYYFNLVKIPPPKEKMEINSKIEILLKKENYYKQLSTESVVGNEIEKEEEKEKEREKDKEKEKVNNHNNEPILKIKLNINKEGKTKIIFDLIDDKFIEEKKKDISKDIVENLKEKVNENVYQDIKDLNNDQNFDQQD
ncbi:nuclear segregation protein bfr1 [Anaeramoeba flamelloides]|uniref:Nuclear segregation protein bfr1 n=1 Tax=Anaeramoeba flamelloides TaxID=1746091 RepID=A0AAV7ZDP1_9EUKA|nr:nuclear segregation protein bfr1 [Anaeramoeba flamelloides]